MAHTVVVGMVKPPLLGHSTRGTGIYAQSLYDSLKNHQTEIKIEWVEYNKQYHVYDLIHYPYFDPFFLTLPIGKSYPYVVTVHDLIPLGYPDHFPKGIKGSVKWFFQRSSLSKARRVITDSDFSCKQILKYTSVPKSHVSVISLGVDKKFEPIDEKGRLQDVKKKFRLPDLFVLFVGDVNYNKNIPNLLRTYNILKKKIPNIHLVLLGRGFSDSSREKDEMMKIIERLSISSHVHFLSNLSLEELVSVYSLAKVYFHPAYAEGFGLPILEAMACGLPVVASNGGSIPEVVRENAILVSPTNCEEMAKNILSLLTDQTYYQKFRQKGIQWASRFTWDNTAKLTLLAYEEALHR